MRLLDATGAPVKSAATGATLVTIPSWHEQVAFTHSWSAADAILYTPSAGEQSEYGVSATPRVESIPDRGTGNDPLTVDGGGHATAYSHTLRLPGPQLISESRRFKRHAAVHFDQVDASPLLYSMLSPQAEPNDSAYYFNTPTGYQAPYWVATLCRVPTLGEAVWDSTLGSDTAINAGPTIAQGNQAGSGTDWSAATWWDDGGGFAPDPDHSTGVVRSSHTQSVDESVLIMFQVTRGTNAATIYVYWRNAAGYVEGTNVAGTTASTSVSTYLRDVFFGWQHESYLCTAGIKSGTIGLGDVANLVAWAGPWLPPASSEASEP